MDRAIALVAPIFDPKYGNKLVGVTKMQRAIHNNVEKMAVAARTATEESRAKGDENTRLREGNARFLAEREKTR